MVPSDITNMLSIDVEDYFHVSAFEAISPPSSWGEFECRVGSNTDRILEILAGLEVRATFFVLGWVARFSPALVRKIAAMGHEIASHGFGHQRVTNLSRSDFREDIRMSKKILEDIIGEPVNGYRAPSYSISTDSLWAFDELVDAGYTYDSSVFPVRHDFYGISDWPRFPFALRRNHAGDWAPDPGFHAGGEIVEIPITTLNRAGRNFPIAGGGYFRLYPYAVTRKGLKHINEREERPFIFYIHPWEFDPNQPRMKNAGFKSRFRHYLNLDKTGDRFVRLLGDFRFASIADVIEAEAHLPDPVQFAVPGVAVESSMLH